MTTAARKPGEGLDPRTKRDSDPIERMREPVAVVPDLDLYDCILCRENARTEKGYVPHEGRNTVES